MDEAELIRIHPRGVLTLVGFVALFALGLYTRLGIAAVAAAMIVDWLYIGIPLWPARRATPPRR